jgi:hypothetical protein
MHSNLLEPTYHCAWNGDRGKNISDAESKMVNNAETTAEVAPNSKTGGRVEPLSPE